MKAKVTLTKTNEDFNYWIGKDFISESLKSSLVKSDLLFVPNIGFRERKDLNFPVNTMEQLEFVKDNSDMNLITDICIEDKDYKELALHFDWILLADIVIKDFVLPIYLGILSNYLHSKWKDKLQNKKIKIEITLVKNGESIKIKYEGPEDAIKDTILKELKNYSEKKDE
jgi:hypothetical protein